MPSLKETPEYFIIEVKYAKEESTGRIYMSSVDRWKFIQMHQHLSPEMLVKNFVNFHHTLSMPMVCIIITMIGIPVGAHTGRKGAFAGIMLALGMFFGFYFTQFTMEYLAKRQFISFWTSPGSQISHFDAAEAGTYIWIGPWTEAAQVIGSFNIAPWVGPWGAIIAFFAIGGIMIHRMR